MIQLNEILKVDETAEEYISLNQVLSRCAQKQRKLDALVLPNKTQLARRFSSIKNNLASIDNSHQALSLEVQCLLDQHLCQSSEGYKNSFSKEVNSLAKAIDTYIEATTKKDDTLPQGQYADSVVPIADAVKTYFPNIPIKSHRNSKFHEIMDFYFKQYLNVHRENYCYIIDQALSNLK